MTPPWICIYSNFAFIKLWLLNPPSLESVVGDRVWVSSRVLVPVSSLSVLLPPAVSFLLDYATLRSERLPAELKT